MLKKCGLGMRKIIQSAFKIMPALHTALAQSCSVCLLTELQLIHILFTLQGSCSRGGYHQLDVFSDSTLFSLQLCIFYYIPIEHIQWVNNFIKGRAAKCLSQKHWNIMLTSS